MRPYRALYKTSYDIDIYRGLSGIRFYEGLSGFIWAIRVYEVLSRFFQYDVDKIESSNNLRYI